MALYILGNKGFDILGNKGFDILGNKGFGILGNKGFDILGNKGFVQRSRGYTIGNGPMGEGQAPSSGEWEKEAFGSVGGSVESDTEPLRAHGSAMAPSASHQSPITFQV